MATNHWNDSEAAKCASDLELRAYSSRLLGADPDLVLHGGGNTSVKIVEKDVFGDPVEVLYVKGSGFNLSDILPEGFAPCRVELLRKLRGLDELDDRDMERELRAHAPLDAPAPSVEALLHAFLPPKFIDHTHANAILALTNQPDGPERVKKLFGDRAAVAPYFRPGLALAKACADAFDANPGIEGIVLLHHGVVAFGETAKETYDRMIGLVETADEYIRKNGRRPAASAKPERRPDLETAETLAALKAALLKKGFRPAFSLVQTEEILSFVDDPAMPKKALRGPLTPDHVTRTKMHPALLPEKDSSAPEKLAEVLDRFIVECEAYFDRNKGRSAEELTPLDPHPRVALLPKSGVIGIGRTASEAKTVADIFVQTIATMNMADAVGEYRGLSEDHYFDLEYWSLQQAKLKKAAAPPPLAGKTALITGAAQGIGLGVARRLARDGANVALLDLNKAAGEAALKEIRKECAAGNDAVFIKTDVSDRAQVARAFEQTVLWTGGPDIVVSNAGIFPRSAELENIEMADWEKSASVNLHGAFHATAEAMKWLKRIGGGDLIFIASKNVPAPGKKAGSYSVMKAGQTQLARVAALEGGGHGIRVNMLHPHLILDTNIWSDEVLRQRAAAYGMTVDKYRTNNLLKTGLTSDDVGAAVAALVGGAFSKTTGAQIPIDGGSDRTL